jgi:site-specific DNA recombinase
MAGRRARRCAIYTRKSTEGGLEQSFNSLDAQRDACEAYIRSQRSEGWRALPGRYDDGGFSGGAMDRPALGRLLADIAAGRVDVVVVYKIDRLTRSLADFARMVELFDRHEVTFVSAAQSFNTTGSMGRLTLNVLLSFAQFEREITGERIRDKIAASKARGMWMGGVIPLGYDRARDGGRALVVNESEAALVRSMFAAYLDLGSVHELVRRLAADGVVSKITVSASGRRRGGGPYSRGALHHLLRNRLYRGEIGHMGRFHQGLHPAIIEADLFDAVQARLDAQTRRRGDHARKVAPSPLTGRIFDADGAPMSPTSARGRGRAIYRYHVSAPLQQGARRALDDPNPRRVASADLEQRLATRLQEIIEGHTDGGDHAALLARIHRIDVRAGSVVVAMAALSGGVLQARLRDGEQAVPDPADPLRVRLSLPWDLRGRRVRTRIEPGDRTGARPDPALISALRRAHALLARDRSGLPWLEDAPSSPYRRRLIRLAFLAPDLQQAILEGRQPAGLRLARLMEEPLPSCWARQRSLFGAA